MRRYERLAPLLVDKAAVALPEGVQAGDCVVAFSRQKVHNLRRTIEAHTGHRCSVVRPTCLSVYRSVCPRGTPTSTHAWYPGRLLAWWVLCIQL